MTETIYIVKCDECGLYESYKNERIARGHKNSHWDDYEHVAKVEEAEAYEPGENPHDYGSNSDGGSHE